MYRVGIDVGGTNTDAALLKESAVVETFKTPTTRDVLSGVHCAVSGLLARTSVPVASVGSVVLGTTSFLNALLQASDKLARVCVIRLANAGSVQTPPFIDFPADLAARVTGPVAVVPGGVDVSGKAFAQYDAEAVARVAEAALAQGISDFAISSCFSTVDPRFEHMARDTVRSVATKRGFAGKAKITLSSEIGQLGLLQRENAAILNASLRPFARITCRAFARAMASLGVVRERVFMSSNDGTVLDIAQVARFPVLTIGAGPTNSMRGAAFLSGLPAAVVADIGGTSTDVGVLERGFPRRASMRVRIAGVSTNFSMPDVTSIALGGGSIVHTKKDEGSSVVCTEIGPVSLGYRLLQEGVCFGGETLCTSDIAVAAGRADFGDRARVMQRVTPELVASAQQVIQEKLAAVVDAVKTSADAVPLVLVGGGSVLVEGRIAGTSETIFPKHFSSANAVGAALPKVSGSADMVFPLKTTSRADAISAATAAATTQALAHGALKETIEVIELLDTTSTYVAESLRVQVKVAGDLSPSFVPPSGRAADGADEGEEDILADLESTTGEELPISSSPAPTVQPSAQIVSVASCMSAEPLFATGQWIVTEQDAVAIALGAGVLGTGGGGSTYTELLRLRNLIRKGAVVRVVPPDTVPDDAVAFPLGMIGSPTVILEKFFAYAAPMALDRSQKLSGKKLTHLFAIEIGGTNGLMPLLAGGQMNVPVIDCDGMGRAFPQVSMFYPIIAGVDLCPMCLCTEEGEFRDYVDLSMAEIEQKLGQDVPDLGCACGFSVGPLSGKQVKSVSIKGSISRAWSLGKRILEARERKEDPIAAAVSAGNGAKIFFGKITQVSWLATGRFSTREVCIDGLGPLYQGQRLSLFVQNENIVARIGEKVLASVPDLICLLAEDTAEPVFTEELKYGTRVAVAVLPSNPLYHAPAALAAAGPTAFGFEFPFVPFVVTK